MEFKEDEKASQNNPYVIKSNKWQIPNGHNLPKKSELYAWINTYTGEDGLGMEVEGYESEVYLKMKNNPEDYIYYILPHPKHN